jgi:lipoyl(octanoyl) transferase
VNICDVYPYEIADGPANMALDEAILEAVGRGEVAAALRVYGWSVPTLSLGYFQRMAEVRADARWSEVPIVRRLTGGGAIWHHHEVTYAIVVPEGHELARPSVRLYRAVHGAISGGLVGLGIGAVRLGEVFSPGDCGRSRPLLCFTDRSPEDIVCEGTKIVGSAQRRRWGAVLQHGSVLLARSSRTPELGGLSDFADGSDGPREWSNRLVEWITKGVGLSALPARIPESIRVGAAAREAGRYRDPGWTEIR